MKKMNLYIGEKHIAEAIADDAPEFSAYATDDFPKTITGYIGIVENITPTSEGFIFQLCEQEIKINAARPDWLKNGARIQLDLIHNQIRLITPAPLP